MQFPKEAIVRKSNFNGLKSDLKKLKILLIILTLIQIIYFTIIFTDDQLWFKLDFTYKANYLVFIFHSLVTLIFVWYNWKKLPIEKIKKTDNTYLILFLGTLGMWVWISKNKRIENPKN